MIQEARKKGLSKDQLQVLIDNHNLLIEKKKKQGSSTSNNQMNQSKNSKNSSNSSSKDAKIDPQQPDPATSSQESSIEDFIRSELEKQKLDRQEQEAKLLEQQKKERDALLAQLEADQAKQRKLMTQKLEEEKQAKHQEILQEVQRKKEEDRRKKLAEEQTKILEIRRRKEHAEREKLRKEKEAQARAEKAEKARQQQAELQRLLLEKKELERKKKEQEQIELKRKQQLAAEQQKVSMKKSKIIIEANNENFDISDPVLQNKLKDELNRIFKTNPGFKVNNESVIPILRRLANESSSPKKLSLPGNNTVTTQFYTPQPAQPNFVTMAGSKTPQPGLNHKKMTAAKLRTEVSKNSSGIQTSNTQMPYSFSSGQNHQHNNNNNTSVIKTSPKTVIIQNNSHQDLIQTLKNMSHADQQVLLQQLSQQSGAQSGSRQRSKSSASNGSGGNFVQQNCSNSVNNIGNVEYLRI